MNPSNEPVPDGSGTSSPATPDDPRVLLAAQAFLHELEAGKRPDRRQWLARYPDLAEPLDECLQGLEIVYRGTAAFGPSPSGSGRMPRADEPASSLPLGDFRIVREIARGGMGVVHEAVQLSLGRRVALKVLPFAANFDSRQLERFRQEAQAAAQLHHSNIVPVYAVGCERGTHFYAMQLIDGRSLDVVICDLRKQAGLTDTPPAATSRALDAEVNASTGESIDRTAAWTGSKAAEEERAAAEPTTDAANETLRKCLDHFSTHDGGKTGDFHRMVARSMAQAAEALEYAHQQGIVHRDIKPANLLLDTRGSIWVTDFGLAHFQANPGLTATGDLVGTVRYMSPEQASGQRVILDHRTDVYSLGATFYELLTLRPVFAGATRNELLSQVMNRDPRPLRALDRRIPVELETIVLKALDKSPADRYSTAQDLADDLNRFLRDEPIQARPPSALDRVRKWLRRHPSVLVAAVSVMFLTLVGSLVSNWLIGAANDRARTALAGEKQRAEEAEQRFRQARQAVDLLIEVSEEADRPPMEHLRKRLLESALVYYQDFISQRRDDPSSQAELIAVEKRLKKILDDVSVLEGAGQVVTLSDQRVQADLILSDSQVAQLHELERKSDETRRYSMRDFQRLNEAQRRERFLELARSNEKAVQEILDARQSQRLAQINLQIKGIFAFDEKEVAARLGLTDAQRAAIRQIESETMSSLWDRGGPGGSPPPGPPPDESPGDRPPADDPPDSHGPNGPFGSDDHGRRPGRGPHDDHHPPGNHSRDHEAFRTAMEKALKVLTPAQSAAWKDLTGDPFAGAFDMPSHSFTP